MGLNSLWHAYRHTTGRVDVYALMLRSTSGDISADTEADLSIQYVRSVGRRATEADHVDMQRGHGRLVDLATGQDSHIIQAIFRHFGQDVDFWLQLKSPYEVEVLHQIMLLRHVHDSYPDVYDWKGERRRSVDVLVKWVEGPDPTFDVAIRGALLAARSDPSPKVRAKVEEALRARGWTEPE